MLTRAMLLVACTSAFAPQVHKTAPLTRRRFTEVPEALETARFVRVDPECTDDKPVLLALGGLDGGAPPTPSPEKLWSLHAAELGGYAAAAPFAPFSELMKVGPWRPQTPPKPPDPLARVPADASCSLAVFISAAQRAWLVECARVRDARRAARVSARAATEAAAKRARRPDAARVPKRDVEDMLEAWARAGWRAPASAPTALPAARERLGNAELAEYSLRDLEELLEVVLVDSAGHLDVEHAKEWREDWAWEPWPSQPRPKVKWAKRFLGTDAHDEAKWHRIRSDYASTVMSRMHHTCLLYTSPSPRDQRGSGLPGCGW